VEETYLHPNLSSSSSSEGRQQPQQISRKVCCQ